MSEEHEHEFETSRDEAATVLHKLGEGVAAGSVRIGGEDGVTVEIPVEVEVEIEYEPGDEPGIEVELEWEGEEVEDEGDDEAADETDESEETLDETADAKEEEADPEETEPDEGEVDEAEEDEPAPAVVDAVVPADGDEGPSGARFELYRDRADEWRWRLVHRNGNVIADSGEGYDRKAGARNGLESVMTNAAGATVVEQD